MPRERATVARNATVMLRRNLAREPRQQRATIGRHGDERIEGVWFGRHRDADDVGSRPRMARAVRAAVRREECRDGDAYDERDDARLQP